MFFFFSKTLNYLMMPLVVITIFFVLSAFLKNKLKKWCFFSGLVLLLLFSNDFVANELMTAWEIPATPFEAIHKKYEWAVLLSGVARGDMEPKDRVYFGRGADRVFHTVQLYKLGIVKKILVSGGSGRLLDIGERESVDLANAMAMMGVRPEDIFIEGDSRNTHESAVKTKKMLFDIGTSPDKCILVTSGYHMRRALGCFNKAGWPMDSFSADFLSHPRSFTFDILFIPKIEALTTWHHLIKETVGYISYAAVGYI